LILADEPTSGLDSRTARRVLALFESVANTQGTTFLIVSHDPMVANYVDVAYDLYDGRLVPHGSHKEELICEFVNEMWAHSRAPLR